MIESTTVPLAAFDLKGFVKDDAKFLRKWYGDDSLAYLIVGIQKYGDTPVNFCLMMRKTSSERFSMPS